jgi:hypothetical protein
MQRPDPHTELRMVALHPVRGANYWSRRPVVRMDVSLGVFDEISSADIPGIIDEHQCSVGHRGGFNERLRRGTYAAHIMEHVALELQSMVGYDVGYGRTRGSGEAGVYTVIIEHQHELVGLRATALAFEIVQQAFSEMLGDITSYVDELRALTASEPMAQLDHRVWCGVTGDRGRAETCAAFAQLWQNDTNSHVIVDLSPASLFYAGLPYSQASLAIILDDVVTGVPERYRDGECAARLLSIVADALPDDGVVICPENAHALHEAVRRAERQIRTFAPHDTLATHVQHAVSAARDVTAVLH